MEEQFKEYKAKVLGWWNGFLPKQKTIIIAIFAVVVFSFAILIYMFSRTQYTRLITCNTLAEASEVTEILKATSIDYNVSSDGMVIYVDEAQTGTANVALGAAGYAPDEPDLKDYLGSGFTTTESERQRLAVAYKEAQMESDFESFSAVKSAKVQLNIPENNGTLIASKEESYAYIRLELNGIFTSDNAATMARAAATALGNTTTENIVIVDTNANLLFSGDGEYSSTGQASTFLELQNQAEAYIRAKVQQALLGTGQFDMVEVAPFLRFDQSSYTRTDKNYASPEGGSGGLVVHSESTESENSSGSGGVPGTDSNNEQTYVYEDGGNSSSSASSSLNDYVVDESLVNTITPAGIIDYGESSVTVSAISYNIIKEENVTAQGLLDGTTWELYKINNEGTTKIDVDQDFINAVATATGIDASKITIIAYRENLFYDKETTQINWTDILSIVMILIILGLLGFVIFTSMHTKREVEVEEELSVESLLQSTPESELADIELETKSETRLMVEKFVDENPEAAAVLLRNWLEEDWG